MKKIMNIILIVGLIINVGIWYRVNYLSHSKYNKVGKDTVCSFADGKFQIGKFGEDTVFFMCNESDTTIQPLLNKVKGYKKIRKVLYVKSEEGYAIVDSNTNLCRLFITILPEDFVDGWMIDENGNKHFNTRFVESDNIKYLSTYDEFSKEEKKIMESLTRTQGDGLG